MKGRTRQGRLRALDAYLVRREPALLAEPSAAPFVDLGFGVEPVTTLEAAAAFRALNPALPVIGIESDAGRAARAQRFADGERTRFVHGDFGALPHLPRARLLRVMNVLRAMREEELAGAHALFGQAIVEGGLVVEGSADPPGDLLTAHLLRRRDGRLVREGVLFFTTFAHGFAPFLFRDWLPRDFRRRVRPGTAIAAFFERWTAVWKAVRTRDPRASFVASLAALAPEGDLSLAAEGYFIWKPAGGVPEAR